jgi:hypothetical protein
MFCGNNISVLPVAIRKYLFRIVSQFSHFFLEGFLRIFLFYANKKW